jgi:hypothetical protein
VGDLKAGSGESFLIGGFLAVALFFLLSKIGVRVFARKLHAHEQNYRRRKGKGELNREAEEGISVHASTRRNGEEEKRGTRVMGAAAAAAARVSRASIHQRLLHLHPPTH